ncbi:MAG: PAS domain S-box protein [Candidatus Omnitrophica bacterium]|nr:PAS domain S-box protein [Candidatus Omnitrophota bacterium]
MSLKSRLAILFFAISFLPSIFIGILTYNNYAELSEKDKLQALDQIANYKQIEITLYFSRLIDDIKSTQSSWCIRENLPAIIEFSQDPSNPKFISAKKILDERFQPTQKTWGLLDIMLADTNGRVVYGTNVKHVHHFGPVPDPGERSFKEGLKDVYVTDIFQDPAENGKSKILISAPDFNSKGSLIGVIIFEVDLSQVYRLIQSFIGLKNTGETLIAMKINDEAVYLNPLRHDPKAAFTRRIKIGSNFGIPIQNAVQGQTGHDHSIDYRGVKVIAAWRYIPSLRWGIVTKIDTSEAFKDDELLKYILFIALGILLITCLVISRIIADAISGSREKLSKEIDEHKKVEKEIAKYRDHLEDIVKERIAEISTLNRNIEFILGATKTGLDIIDSEYNMVYIDPEWQKIYGDPKGKKCYAYFMGKEAVCPICGVREALEKKKPVVTEEILAKEDNRPIQVTTIPYQDKNGNWLVAEINVDITDRKKAEEFIRGSEQRLRVITNTIPSVVYTYQMTSDGKQKFIFISDMVKSVFGLPKEEVLTDFYRLWSLIIPEERDKLYESIQLSYKTLKLWQYDWRIRTISGDLKWIHGESIPEAPKDDGSVVWNGTFSDITARKNMEEELKDHKDHLEELIKERTEEVRKSEARLQFALEVSHTGAWDLDLADHTAFRSIEHDRIFGYAEPLPRWTYEMFLEHVLPEDRETVDRKFQHALETETDWNFECRIRRTDGVVCWIWATGRHQPDASGKKHHMTGILQDITERKKSETALQVSETRYRRLFESAKDGILILNAETGKIVDVNPFITDILKYSAEELLGKELWEIGSFKDIADSKKAFLELQNKGYVLYNNLPLETKDGRVVEVEFVSNKYKVDHTYVLQCNIRDIAERRRIEAALEISEASYRAIFELASDAIIIRDMESYTIVDANEQACELLCYPKDELLATPPEAIFPDEAPDNWKYVKPIYAKAAAGEPQSIEILFKDKAGRTFWVETHIKRAVIGGVYRLLAIAHDISERKESEKKIVDLNNSIARANEELKKLALIDSHTGLYNYHYYSGVIEAEFSRAQRLDGRLSLIMMDIDYFKSINDVYGHQFGDLVLKQFAELLKKTVRLYDTVIRFGGEEFIIITPGAGNEEAIKLAKRTLNAINSFSFGNDTHSVKLKISAACGSYPDDSRIKNSSDFINIADSILSKAKEEGGNRAYSSLDYKTPENTKLGKEEPNIVSLKDKIIKLTTRGNQSVAEAIFAFAKTIELKDSYTGAHVDDTMRYAVKIAEKLGLEDNEVETVKYAAALHDLGKVGIPEAILHKTEKLTEEEFEIIKKHPQIGVDIIRPIHFLHDIIPAIFHHHEHWDGTGYPGGLKAEMIPLGARIVSVADAYQAMISDRPYRKAFAQEKAAEILRKNSGTQFDPSIVSAFLEILKTEKRSQKTQKK